MAISTRFPVAVHILTLLAAVPDEFVSSSLVARSVDTNPVVIRRVLAMLQSAGFVESRAGSQGGTRIVIDPTTLTLLDVYRAVETTGILQVHDAHDKCPVANVVCEQLARTLETAETALEASLGRQTLDTFTRPATRALQKYLKQHHGDAS